VPIKGGDIVKLFVAVVLTAILFEFWLTTPVLEDLTQNQWRLVAVGVMVLLGVSWSLAQWNLSTLFAGSMVGLLVGGTRVSLPISHGRIGEAFRSILGSFAADMIAFTFAAIASAYLVSRLRHSHGYSLGRHR
jgi:hypothetical protein